MTTQLSIFSIAHLDISSFINQTLERASGVGPLGWLAEITLTTALISSGFNIDDRELSKLSMVVTEGSVKNEHLASEV